MLPFLKLFYDLYRWYASCHWRRLPLLFECSIQLTRQIALQSKLFCSTQCVLLFHVSFFVCTTIYNWIHFFFVFTETTYNWNVSINEMNHWWWKNKSDNPFLSNSPIQYYQRKFNKKQIFSAIYIKYDLAIINFVRFYTSK